MCQILSIDIIEPDDINNSIDFNLIYIKYHKEKFSPLNSNNDMDYLYFKHTYYSNNMCSLCVINILNHIN